MYLSTLNVWHFLHLEFENLFLALETKTKNKILNIVTSGIHLSGASNEKF